MAVGIDGTPPTYFSFELEDYEKVLMTPWLSYQVSLPIFPLPKVEERPEIRTERLVLRALLPSDLEAFHTLRSDAEAQKWSPTRGRASRDLDESRAALERLQAPHDEDHWYFGAFLATTGELIGELGIPNAADNPRSGWPEAEIVVRSAYWRQGYGSEMFRGFLDAWWALPRQRRRHQLVPFSTGYREPGEEVVDAVGFVWEEDNAAACAFFSRMVNRDFLGVEGKWLDVEHRDGREPAIVNWEGALIHNPTVTPAP